MKLVSYVHPDHPTVIRTGIAVDGGIADVQDASRALGIDVPGGIVELLTMGDDCKEILTRVEEAAGSGKASLIPASNVSLKAALPKPTTIYLLAANYQSHITESGAAPVNKDRITPRPFIKPNSSVIGTQDEIPIPLDSNTLDYEIEIAAVIGKSGKNIDLESALSHVAGYTVFNDISARSLKISEGRDDRNGDWFFDWLLGKWCDGFSAVGPYLVTSDEIADPRDLEMSLRVNGELRQHSAAGEMIFNVPETIAFLSRFVTLQPGDMICMGTPGGVGDTTATYLQHGDEIEATIEQLGSMTNTVVASSDQQ